MARDIFVRFASPPPGRREVEADLEAYMGTAMEGMEFSGGRIVAILRGKNEMPEIHRDDRWIEVYQGEDYWDVITREQDELVNVLAEGFARRIARKFGGALDEGV